MEALESLGSSKIEIRQKHLTGINHLSAEDIGDILLLAADYAEAVKRRALVTEKLKGRVIFSLFFEASTRTRMSFEVAAKRLGAEVVNWSTEASSLKKGESFADTLATLNAMRPDGVIIRHSEYGAPEYTAGRMECPVINAGDSWREHPTQALLDALTIQQAKGQFEGLTIAICGDIAHSRVAASNMILLRKMGANVRIIAPPVLMPEKLPADGVEKFDSLEEGLKGCDIIMALRTQKERMESGLIGSDTDYFNSYGITPETLVFAKDDALVMHPGPMNRGVEISDDVADDPQRSLILGQVTNGVAVRMAVLDLLMSGR